MALVECKDCLVASEKIRAERDSENKFIYRDLKGKRWNRRACPDCVRAAWKSDRNELQDHKNKLAVQSELYVAKFFEDQGFTVTQTAAHGPDLLLNKDGKETTCEVKTAIGKIEGFWFVPPVYPNRQGDDLLAIVLPDGRVHLEEMNSHLSKCSGCGARAITHLIRPVKRRRKNQT